MTWYRAAMNRGLRVCDSRLVMRRCTNFTINVLKQHWTEWNETLLGIRTTATFDRSESANRPWWRGPVSAIARHDDNKQYAPLDYWNARKLLRLLDPGESDVVIDIGAGMGRVVCLAARRRIRKSIGIELSESLCYDARRNAALLRMRKAPIEIVCGDAASADLSEGTIYIMFNPFGPATLHDTLHNISRSLQTHPRPIKILYYNSLCESVLNDAAWLQKVTEYRSFGGLRVTLWESRPYAIHISSSSSRGNGRLV